MASSSSAISTSPTCSSPSSSSSSSCFSSALITWRYDVFLCFSGLDTRNSFCDHLYRALIERGIKVFRDDKKLQKGEDIGENISRAISSSRFSIVLLSRNFAASEWCLDELVKIIECKNEKLGHVTFPVFYQVKPDDVMNQVGCYGEFFLAHELKFGDDRVLRWRAALTAIARFCGWDVPNHRSESKLVRIIVDKLAHYLKFSSSNSVSNRLVPFAVKPIDFYSYEGLDNIGIVRICGMDGMGRTTVARVVYDAVVNEKLGNDCFRQVVSEMPKECIRYIWDIDAVINAIRKKMVHKKVLLLVDHVDTLEQVASLLVKHAYGWVVPKSRIIVSASTPSKTILNTLDISFHVPEATENNISVDIACFVTEMDDSHVTRIIRSLVSTNLCTNSGIKVLINKALINISDFDKPLNIAESTSLDMLLDIGCNGDSSKLSQHWKTKKRSKNRQVYKISVNGKIRKHNRAKSSITASQKEALLSLTSRGKSAAGSEKIDADRLQSVHKSVIDAKNDVVTESVGVNIEQNPILLRNSLATACDDSINGGTLVLQSSDNETNECDSAFAHNISLRRSVSGMLFSSKAGDRQLQYFMPEVLNDKKIVRIPEAVIAEGIKQWELCLVGQFLGQCSEISLVLNKANELWGKEGRIEVTKTKNGLHVFKFPNENIRDLVLESAPWYIANKPLVLRMWQPDMQLSELNNSKIPVWVKLSGIPMEYMTTKGVSYIASALGTPLYTATTATCCLDFVKVCIEVSIEDDVLDFITVKGCDGEELRVEVEYLWKPEKCITCKEFGHSFLECPSLCCTDTPFQ